MQDSSQYSQSNNFTDLLVPVEEWHDLQHIDWHASDLIEGFYQALVPVNDDISLSVEAGGNPKNPPLLLIMGLGSQMVFWSTPFVLQLVKAGFFVIRFDNRDIGCSSKVIRSNPPNVNVLKMMMRHQVGLSNRHLPVAYTLYDMAEDTYQLIQTLNFGKINILGGSMGGMIAQIVAGKYPECIDNLILLFTSTNASLQLPPKPRQLSVLFNKPKDTSEAASVKHGLKFVFTVGSPGHIDTKKVTKMIKMRYKRSHHPLGALQQLHAVLATGSVSKFSKRIKAPTLVLHGSKDGLILPAHGRRVAKTIQNAKFIAIEGMGHDLAEYFQPFLVENIRKHCFD